MFSKIKYEIVFKTWNIMNTLLFYSLRVAMIKKTLLLNLQRSSTEPAEEASTEPVGEPAEEVSTEPA